MTLPTIIIAAARALKAVPPSIREAALGVGASHAAGGVPSRAAAGDARHHDRHHHRHGACARRDGAAADDRHGGLHRRYARRLHRCRDRAAGADIHVGRQPGARLRRADLRRDHRASGLPVRDERGRRRPAQAIRTALVEMTHQTQMPDRRRRRPRIRAR